VFDRSGEIVADGPLPRLDVHSLRRSYITT
jgi:hypothetical protein